MTRLIFIGGTRHGESAPETDEGRIVAINDGTVYVRRELQRLGDADVSSKTEFFVYEALAHDEALELAQPYW